MEFKEQNYFADLEIDEYNLIEEWQNQAGLFMSYASSSADTQQELDDTKDRLDVKQAQVELDIRNGVYPLAGDVKVTDKAVAALVTNDPEVIKLKQQYNELKKEATLYKKIEQAFEMRKKALENIVILTGREQYAEPRDKSGDVETRIINEKEQKIQNKLNKLNQR
jgi:hypothetical protein